MQNKSANICAMPADISKIGSAPLVTNKRQTWVQTERSSHEAWADLVRSKPRAAALLHTIVANMNEHSALVASRPVLARMEKVSEATIKRAVADLKAGNWIEVVQVGGKGGVNAYVVNSRVAWANRRDQLPTAMFTATVIADASEQDKIETTPLRALPALYPGEAQLPHEPEEAHQQPELDGVEPPPLPELRLGEKLDTKTGEITQDRLALISQLRKIT